MTLDGLIASRAAPWRRRSPAVSVQFVASIVSDDKLCTEIAPPPPAGRGWRGPLRGQQRAAVAGLSACCRRTIHLTRRVQAAAVRLVLFPWTSAPAPLDTFKLTELRFEGVAMPVGYHWRVAGVIESAKAPRQRLLPAQRVQWASSRRENPQSRRPRTASQRTKPQRTKPRLRCACCAAQQIR